jgi:putative drug exporter of the RND superfamily
MSKVTARPPAVERIAGWSAKHKKTAVFGWLALIIAAVVIGGMTKSAALNSNDPGEAGRAEKAITASNITQQTENVLVQAPAGSASFDSNAALQSGVSDVTAALRGLPSVVSDLRAPSPGDPQGMVSKDGRSALVTFVVAGDDSTSQTNVAKPMAAVEAVQKAHPDLTIGEAGTASVNKVINDVIGKGFQTAEISSLPITLILLLIVFGALVAASIPLILALTAVFAAISLLSVPGHWLPISSSTSTVVLLIGMAVGVDYSLFYLRREREERQKGRSAQEALRIAARTSGRSILVSGLTVMISLAGLFLSGISEFYGWAAGTMLVVGIAMLGSVTVLPALLSWFGDGVDKGKVPFLGKRRAVARESRFWNFLVRRVVKRPLLWGIPTVALLVVMAAPATGLQARDAGAVAITYGQPISKTLAAMETAFPGGPAPAELIIHGADANGPAVASALDAMKSMLPNGASVTSQASVDGRYQMVSIPLAGDGADQASVTALLNLRSHILPETLGHVAGIDYAVGGQAAGSHDFAAQLHTSTPLVVGFVILLAFLLMVAAFRSLAIPLTAIAVNLLSVAASYGVLKWIFQDGHFEKQLGFQAYGGVVSWLPLFMFVILFGLSMDYHVFIISRIRELRTKGSTTREAIVGGISSSSGVVTSAAAIMVAVFALFAVIPFGPMKMTGIGMAVAVLIDATLVRGILVPAAMSLLGERNWRLPRGLRWIPGIDLEGSASDAAAVQVPARVPAHARGTGSYGPASVPPAAPWVPSPDGQSAAGVR